MGDKCASHRDLAVADLAGRQHGVVTTRQLTRLGFSRNAIVQRARTGRLRRIHHGVYAVGHAGLSREGHWMGAVLACGEEAVLSHRSAAALWELLRPMEGLVDVSIPSQDGRRKRKGIRVHRCPSLTPTEPIQNAHLPNGGVLDGLGLVTIRYNIPVTTPARTVADLKSCVPPHLHRRAIRQAELAGYALGADVQTTRTRSDLEEDFLALCRQAGLPTPEVNVRIGRWTVDFLWRSHRLAVETDSYRYHRGAVAFHDDRARDLDLRRHGLEVRRFSEKQLNEDPASVIADLRAALTS